MNGLIYTVISSQPVISSYLILKKDPQNPQCFEQKKIPFTFLYKVENSQMPKLKFGAGLGGS